MDIKMDINKVKFTQHRCCYKKTKRIIKEDGWVRYNLTGPSVSIFITVMPFVIFRVCHEIFIEKCLSFF